MRPSFAALPGSRFTRDEGGAGGSETGRREKKSDKGREGSAAEHAGGKDKLQAWICTMYAIYKEHADRSMTLQVGDSAFKQQIAHRRFMNARRQVRL